MPSILMCRWWNTCRWLVLLTAVLSMAGCRGCSVLGDPQAQTKKNDKKVSGDEEKQRLNIKPLKMVPSSQDLAVNYIKPGHWYQAKQEIRANQSDESLSVSVAITDRNMKPLPITGTNASLEFVRDVSVAKGQSKNSDLLVFVPEMPNMEETPGIPIKPSIQVTYQQRSSGLMIAAQPNPGLILQPQEYLIPVVSKEPARHKFWAGLSCISWPTTERVDPLSMHRVIELKEAELPSWLPDRMLTWTTISHVVWYDADPTLLTEFQKEALLDWLHFGGTLILSGPDCIGTLSQSFLAPYFPLRNIAIDSVNAELLEDMNQAWTVIDVDRKRIMMDLPGNRSIARITGDLAESSAWVPRAEGLVAERLVGRGRVAIATFPCSDDVFVNWRSYSSFINATLLRKPARQWVEMPLGGDMLWAGGLRGQEIAPALSTRLRLLGRDLGSASRNPHVPPPPMNKAPVRTRVAGPEDPAYVANLEPPNSLTTIQRRTVAGWSDNSGVTSGLAMALRGAAGIEVPKVAVILKLLAGYLVILVPINWLVFRLMGRVEWAWVATPIIAMIGAIVVARSVQLDVGFSRSENRGGVLELYSGYPRGHHTSCTALYTSLTTNYRAAFPNEDGLMLPFGSQTASVRKDAESQMQYRFASDQGGGLPRMTVLSNTTGILHAEQMVSLEGPVVASHLPDGAVQVVNRSSLDLKGMVVFGFDGQRKAQQAWIGALAPGGSSRVELQESSQRWFDQWNDDPVSQQQSIVTLSDGSERSETEAEGVLSISEVFRAILTSHPFERGEWICLGWTDSKVGDLTITPEATQGLQRNVVVVHFGRTELDPAYPDTNLPSTKFTDPDEDPIKTDAAAN
jgi:hypothetical protein